MNTRSNYIDIAIIGGGASGMFAALQAHRQLSTCSEQFKRQITLFERNERVGKKLLSTGNGRCNLTNIECTADHFHGNDTSMIPPILDTCTPQKIISLFEELGVVCTIETDNKVFPASMHAASILDALRLALDEKQITIVSGTKVTAITKQRGTFAIMCENGKKKYYAQTVIIATGGNAAPATGSDGYGYSLLQHFNHSLIAPLPAIVQLTTERSFVKPLSGNKIRAEVSLYINHSLVRIEYGEVLFTDYGLSGPPILQLSGYVSRATHKTNKAKKRHISICIDFLPDYSRSNVHKLLIHRQKVFADRHLEDFLTGLFHRRLAYGLLKCAVRYPLSFTVSYLNTDDITALCRCIKSLSITVMGTRSFVQAQTTAGGIVLSEFDPSTLQSNHCPGLFACGEVLDIDGDCGGYNLHWAWTSGYIAGIAAAYYCQQECKQ